ncbi:hypothetical protein FRB99_000626 [Tulasnella sp. 403]|nr:hypothetical protein FRB99_000626 [Tulasnella sp. 403]
MRFSTTVVSTTAAIALVSSGAGAAPVVRLDPETGKAIFPFGPGPVIPYNSKTRLTNTAETAELHSGAHIAGATQQDDAFQPLLLPSIHPTPNRGAPEPLSNNAAPANSVKKRGSGSSIVDNMLPVLPRLPSVWNSMTKDKPKSKRTTAPYSSDKYQYDGSSNEYAYDDSVPHSSDKYAYGGQSTSTSPSNPPPGWTTDKGEGNAPSTSVNPPPGWTTNKGENDAPSVSSNPPAGWTTDKGEGSAPEASVNPPPGWTTNKGEKNPPSVPHAGWPTDEGQFARSNNKHAADASDESPTFAGEYDGI